MIHSVKNLFLASVACGFATIASSAIIYDFSPDTLGADILQVGDSGPAENISSGTNWIEEPVPYGPFLSSPYKLTGMDIFTRADFVGIGTEVLIKYIKNTPSGSTLVSFNSVISIIDQDGISSSPNNNANDPTDQYKDHVRAFVDFGINAIELDGSLFAIGMSGLTTNIGALLLDYNSGISDPGRDGYAFGFDSSGDPFEFNGDADLAFRLHGTANVPDSGATIALLAPALFGLIAYRRFKANTPPAA